MAGAQNNGPLEVLHPRSTSNPTQVDLRETTANTTVGPISFLEFFSKTLNSRTVSTQAVEPLRLFLADLHLDGDASPHALAFRALLANLASQTKDRVVKLYLLGDLFEFWDEYHPQVIARYEHDLAALEAAHRAGVQLHFADGNRDFLYGRYVEERLAAQLLHDGARVELTPDFAVWVEHGDLICRADVRYLRYRARVRSAPVKTIFRLLPWFIASRLVARISAKSKVDCMRKAQREFEPDLDYAYNRLTANNCQTLVCGHTHRPEVSDLGEGRHLIVLPPWCETQAGYLARGAELVRVQVDRNGRWGPA